MNTNNFKDHMMLLESLVKMPLPLPATELWKNLTAPPPLSPGSFTTLVDQIKLASVKCSFPRSFAHVSQMINGMSSSCIFPLNKTKLLYCNFTCNSGINDCP